MALGERIKECRQNSGMSQEKVAELVGVSRQAVTKWESNQSAPNTENLFKLAEIFGTTVDLLLSSGEESKRSLAEELCDLHKQEEEKKKAARRQRRKKNILAALLIAAGYLLIYLAGRLIWCSSSESTFLGWLIIGTPSGEGSYLYGWLLSSDLFWVAMAISVIPALFGKYRFSATTLGAFILGLLAGILFGPYPEGIPYGHGDYGWAIWGVIYLLSVIAGILLERFSEKIFSLFRKNTR